MLAALVEQPGMRGVRGTTSILFPAPMLIVMTIAARAGARSVTSESRGRPGPRLLEVSRALRGVGQWQVRAPLTPREADMDYRHGGDIVQGHRNPQRDVATVPGTPIEASIEAMMAVGDACAGVRGEPAGPRRESGRCRQTSTLL